MLEKVQVFLAESPVGGAIKAASGAVLIWILDNIASFDLPAVVQVAVVAGLPVIINYFNPNDSRYGMVYED